MATVQILTIPIGSQYIQNIDTDDPEDRNDFKILLIFDSNVTGLTVSGITLSFASGTYTASVIGLEGEKSVYMATIRPPQAQWSRPNYLNVNSVLMTVALAADAVTEGLTGTLSATIRLSKTFFDTDAQTLTKLCDLPNDTYFGLAVEKDAFLLTHGTNPRKLSRFHKNGTLERDITDRLEILQRKTFCLQRKSRFNEYEPASNYQPVRK